MSSILDGTADTGFQTLHRLSRQFAFPEFVKHASPEATLRPENLPSAAYADPRKRLFPCHTKASTWLRTLFFLENKAQFHPKTAQWIERGLDAAADYYGIRKEVTALKTAHVELNKEASLPDSSYAIVWVGDDGRKDRRYPLRNSGEVKTAAEWFAQYRDSFHFADRQTIATKILEKAAHFGVGFPAELDCLLEKQAGRGVYDPQEAAEMIRNRAMLQRVPQPVREGLLKLAGDVKSNPMLAEDPTTTAELANTVDQFDRNFGLVGKYSASFPRPEDVLFKGSLKHASEFVKNACAILTGSIYSKHQFAKLSVDHVREALGHDIADAVTTGIRLDPEKMAEVAVTLPLPDAEAFDRLMRAVGEPPVRAKAATVGLNQTERQKLAAEYKFVNALPEVDSLPTPSGVAGSRVINA